MAGTAIAWEQPAKILPIDPVVRDVILRIEHGFETALEALEKHAAHLPSRVRSLLWILSAIPVLAEFGYCIADESEVRAELCARLPALQPEAARLGRGSDMSARRNGSLLAPLAVCALLAGWIALSVANSRAMGLSLLLLALANLIVYTDALDLALRL